MAEFWEHNWATGMSKEMYDHEGAVFEKRNCAYVEVLHTERNSLKHFLIFGWGCEKDRMKEGTHIVAMVSVLKAVTDDVKLQMCYA